MLVSHLEEYHLQIPLDTTLVAEFIRWYEIFNIIPNVAATPCAVIITF